MILPTLRRREFLRASLGVPLAGAAAALAQPPAAQDKPRLSWQANETIQAARQVALSILKPNEKDLVHGLELHANFLVFDSYGFSPRAA